MFVFNQTMIRIFGIFILMSMLSLMAIQAWAAAPPVGTMIGTKAVLTYKSADGMTHNIDSNIVQTTIAQVYSVELKQMITPFQITEDVVADIPFSVTNSGNGPDVVTITLPAPDAEFTTAELYLADAAGTVITATAGTTSPLALPGIKSGEQGNFVLRLKLKPGGSLLKGYKIKIKDSNGSEKEELVQMIAVAASPFKVVAGSATSLNEKKESDISFSVTGAATSMRAYFELYVVNKLDITTPLKYDIVNQTIRLDGGIIPSKDMEGTDEKLKKIVAAVPAAKISPLTMKIHIADAKQGDEFLMYVKFSEAEPAGVVQKNASTLYTSDRLLIAYKHEWREPDLSVTANSMKQADKFDVIAEATSGQTLDYTLRLKNNSTFTETYSIESLLATNAIEQVKILDAITAQELSASSGGGLPEIVVDSGDQREFKIQIKLRDGMVSLTAQSVPVQLKALSLLGRLNNAIPIQTLTIAKISKGLLPEMKFSTDDSASDALKALDVAGDLSHGEFYLSVKNPSAPGTLGREYQLNLKQQNATLACASVGCHLSSTGRIVLAGGQTKVFRVRVDMSAITSTFDIDATIVDIVSTAKVKKTIELTRLAALVFSENNYIGTGSPGNDVVVEITVRNRGGDMPSYAYHIAYDKLASPLTTQWPVVFSLIAVSGWSELDWSEKYFFDPMKSQGEEKFLVKISVPKDAVARPQPSLILALREGDGKSGVSKNIKQAVVTLLLTQFNLTVLKEMALNKNCNSTPSDFSKDKEFKVSHGDCLWSRVTFTNPIGAPDALDVIISDRIPKYGQWLNKAEVKTTGGKAPITLSAKDDKNKNVVTDATDLTEGESLTLTYPVKMELQ